MSDKSRDIKIGDVQGGIGAFSGGNISGVAGQNQTGVAGGNISGQVTVAINKLPGTSEPEKPGIKELLIQLQQAIEAEENLNSDEKDEALEQLKILAEAGKNPGDNAMKKLAKNASRILKGIIDEFPNAIELAAKCKALLPLIIGFF